MESDDARLGLASQHPQVHHPLAAVLLSGALAGASVLGVNVGTMGSAAAADDEFGPQAPPIASQLVPQEASDSDFSDFAPPLVSPAPTPEAATPAPAPTVAAKAQVESAPNSVGTAGTPTVPTEAPAPTAADVPEEQLMASGGDFASRVFDATNQVRIANGLPPLAWTTCGASAALDWSMRAVGVGLGRPDVEAIQNACGPALSTESTRTVDEGSAEQLVDSWVNSPSYLANILNPQFTELGVGCATERSGGNDVTTCTLVFLGS